MPAPFRVSLGLPAITWLGLFVAVTQALGTYEYISTSAESLWSVGSIVILMLGGLVVYYLIAAFRKSQGIQLNYVFREIPPE
jgi:hypothetical protein